VVTFDPNPHAPVLAADEIPHAATTDDYYRLFVPWMGRADADGQVTDVADGGWWAETDDPAVQAAFDRSIAG